jgi:hypothetical protein
MDAPYVIQMMLCMHPLFCKCIYANTLFYADAFLHIPSVMQIHLCKHSLPRRCVHACTLSICRCIYAFTLFNAEASLMHPPLCRFISHAPSGMQMHFSMHALLCSSMDACTLCNADGSRLWPWLCGSPPWLVVSTSSCSPSQVPEYIDYLTPR